MAYLRDIVYFIVLLVFSPLLILRSIRTGKYRDGWSEKLLGSAPLRISDRPCVWFHAVSVGEVLLLRPLVDDLARRRPGWDIVVSTGTTTGLIQARRTFPDLVTFYAPLDFSWAVLLRRRSNAADRLGPGRTQALAQPDRRRQTRRRFDRDHQRPLKHSKLSRLPSLARAAIDLEPNRRRGGAIGRIRQAVRRPRRSRRSRRVTGSVKYDGLEADRDNPKTLACAKSCRCRRSTSFSSPEARWKGKKPPPWRRIAPRGFDIIACA